MRRCGGSGGAGTVAMCLLALLLLLPMRAGAQLPVEVWVRPLIAVPVGGLASRDDGLGASTRAGFDAGGSLTIGALAFYGEYQEITFGCEECAEVGLEGKVLDNGWGAGVQVPLRSPLRGLQPWARLGLIGHHLRFRHVDESAYSRDSLGWSAGLGAEARLLRWLRVEPALLVRRYDAGFRFAIDVPDRDVSVTYIALGLGIGVGL